jgi:hypothetical protein
MAIVSWTPENVINATAQQLERGMTLGMLAVHATVVKKLSIGQPVTRTKSGRLVGLGPSTPPDPPHVLTGRLRQSIAWEVERTETAVIGRVGTNVVYARRLELGFVGTDAAGRNINQAPRPYLRPSLEENRTEILRRLGAK